MELQPRPPHAHALTLNALPDALLALVLVYAARQAPPIDLPHEPEPNPGSQRTRTSSPSGPCSDAAACGIEATEVPEDDVEEAEAPFEDAAALALLSSVCRCFRHCLHEPGAVRRLAFGRTTACGLAWLAALPPGVRGGLAALRLRGIDADDEETASSLAATLRAAGPLARLDAAFGCSRSPARDVDDEHPALAALLAALPFLPSLSDLSLRFDLDWPPLGCLRPPPHAGLASLPSLARLRSLRLGDVPVSPPQLASLESLRGSLCALQAIVHLEDGSGGGSSVALAASLPLLRELDLGFVTGAARLSTWLELSSADLSPLTRLRRLRRLRLHARAASLGFLGGYAALEELSVKLAGPGAGVAALAALAPTLRRLALLDPGCGAPLAAALAALHRLEALQLVCGWETAEALAAAPPPFPSLRAAALDCLSSPGAPGCGRVPPALLAHLLARPDLRSLALLCPCDLLRDPPALAAAAARRRLALALAPAAAHALSGGERAALRALPGPRVLLP